MFLLCLISGRDHVTASICSALSHIRNPLELRFSAIKKMSETFRTLCDTMLGICCVGVCECQSENSFVCFGAKPTQRACARDLPWDQKDEGREGPREEGVSRREQSAWEISQEMRVGQRGGQSTEVRKADARTCWPTDAGVNNTRS